MAPNLMKAALAVLVIGSAPFFLFALYGPVDDNPAGLGIMVWVSVPLALVLAASSGVVYLLQTWRQSSAV